MTRILAHHPNSRHGAPALCHPRGVPESSRRTIVAWTLYDFANSGFAAIIQATIFPVYYAKVVVGNAEWRGGVWEGQIGSVSVMGVDLTSQVVGGMDVADASWQQFCVAFPLD